MFFTIDRDVFLKALSRLNDSVPKRSPIPILENVALTVGNIGGEDALQLIVTDLDIEFTETVVCTAERAGAVTLPARLLLGLVRKLPPRSRVEVELVPAPRAGVEPRVRVACMGTGIQAELTPLPIEDFPKPPAAAFTHTFQIEAWALLGLLRKTSFAMSREHARRYLSGVFLHTLPAGGLCAVATDAKVLARGSISLPAGAEGMPGSIIPAQAVKLLRKHLKDAARVAGKMVTVSVSSAKIEVSFAETRLLTKLIGGNFPDYSRAIPDRESASSVVIVDKQLLVGALSMVTAFSVDKERSVRFAFSQDALVLSAVNLEVGVMRAEIEAGYTGDGFEIGFSAARMWAVLAHIEGEQVRLHFQADRGMPAIVEDMADARTLFVIMPMKL